MKITIELEIKDSDVNDVDMLLDETALRIEESFNVGNKFSACKSAKLSCDVTEYEITI